MGTIIFVTVMMPDLGAGEGVVPDVEEVDVDGAAEDVVDESVGVAEDVRELRVEPGIFEGVEVVGMNIDEREVGRGLAEAVRGGKIVE